MMEIFFLKLLTYVHNGVITASNADEVSDYIDTWNLKFILKEDKAMDFTGVQFSLGGIRILESSLALYKVKEFIVPYEWVHAVGSMFPKSQIVTISYPVEMQIFCSPTTSPRITYSSSNAYFCADSKLI